MKSSMENWGELLDRMLRCNRCGFCQDVCPTYKAGLLEMDVARGRIRTLKMIRDGELDPLADRAVLEQADQCLLCGACTANCPSTVPTDQLMQKTRSQILSAKGFSLFHNLIYRGMLGPQERLEKITSLVEKLDRSLCRPGLRDQWARTAAAKALPLISRGLTYLPDPMEKPARRRSAIRAKENQKTPIAYFLGCGTNVFTPRVAQATVNILERLGFEPSIPRLSCCGGPHFAAGDMEKARRLARKNIENLAALDPETIVTDCATCAHTLADYAAFFPTDHPLQATIATLAPRVKDLNAFLVEALASQAPREKTGQPPLKVTYHDPCHAVRGMGVQAEPRQIIHALPGLELVEMDGADSCRGGAGSYAFRHPAMSQKILDRKIQAIAETGADILATSCPSCTLQLGAGLRRAGLSIPVLNPVELL
ncbi:MAG: (Fe-S)-binding protein [Desulfobacterales bacterium]|nr:(Fe-S)-binding protein [Desulfobacterales bacterium]